VWKNVPCKVLLEQLYVTDFPSLQS